MLFQPVHLLKNEQTNPAMNTSDALKREQFEGTQRAARQILQNL